MQTLKTVTLRNIRKVHNIAESSATKHSNCEHGEFGLPMAKLTITVSNLDVSQLKGLCQAMLGN